MTKKINKNLPNGFSNKIEYNLKHHFIEKRVNPNYYENSNFKKILNNYIISDLYRGSTLGVFGKWGNGKSSLLKAVELHINRNNNNNKKMIWIKCWNIIDNNDSEHISIKNKIIKEMYNQLIKNKDLKNLDYIHQNSFSKNNKKKLKIVKTLIISFMILTAVTLITAFILYLNKIIFLEFFQTLMPSTLLNAGIVLISTIYFNVKNAMPQAKYKELENNYFYERIFKELLNRNTSNNSDIIFIFDDLDQLENTQIFEVLQSIKVFLNHKRIKSIFLLDEKNVLDKFKEEKIGQLNSEKFINYNYSNITKYFNYSIRIQNPNFNELKRCFKNNYSKIELLVHETFIEVDEDKQAIFSDFILWNNNFSYSNIIDILNNFIINCNTINHQSKKNDLLNLLLISVFQTCFPELIIELLKDINGKIWTKIKQYCQLDSTEITNFINIFNLTDADSEFKNYIWINDINLKLFHNAHFFKFINKLKNYLLQLENIYDILYHPGSNHL